MLSRRDALKLAIAAGVVSLPAVAGGRLMLDSNGRSLPAAPIFVDDNRAAQIDSPLLIAYPDHANPIVWQEILRVEGLPYAHTQRLAALDPSQLASVAVVMVLPGAMPDDRIELLRLCRSGRRVDRSPAGCKAGAAVRSDRRQGCNR
ncbi:MAG: hypothetical protein IPM07_14960 [Anaerolineales bacterium]|nr:hypothetical protein [Anaerolineales bacterium]